MLRLIIVTLALIQPSPPVYGEPQDKGEVGSDGYLGSAFLFVPAILWVYSGSKAKGEAEDTGWGQSENYIAGSIGPSLYHDFPEAEDRFFSVAIGDSLIHREDEYENGIDSAGVQRELEYLQDMHITDGDWISFKALSYNVYIATPLGNRGAFLYTGAGVGAGLLVFDQPDEDIADMSGVAQFMASLGQRLSDRFQIQLGYRFVHIRPHSLAEPLNVNSFYVRSQVGW